MAITNTLILIALVTTLTGLVAGILIMLLVQERRKSQPTHTADDSRVQLYKEEARLWRDRSNGRLMVEVDGRMLASPQNLRDAQRAALSAAAADWLAWLGLPSAEPERVETPAPVRSPVPAPVVTSAPAAAPPAPVKAVEAPRPATIVAQIDAILQEKLENSPLAGKGIRLTEESGHGVVVWVGLQRYAGIEAVPDPAIVALIRAAVAQWEQQNASGRSA